MKVLAGTAVLALIAFVAACGSDDDGGDTGDKPRRGFVSRAGKCEIKPKTYCRKHTFPNGVDLSRAPLEGSTLSESDLGGANLQYARLRGSNLRYTNFQDADLRGADLTKADLTRARLFGVALWGADMAGANLRGTNMNQRECVGLGDCYKEKNLGINLRSNKMAGSTLSEVKMWKADLRFADLRGANLRYSDFRWANFGEANLEGADLTGSCMAATNLKGANLKRVVTNKVLDSITECEKAFLKGHTFGP